MVPATMRLSIFILLANSLFAQTEYDLLLKGAQVIDPKNKRDSVQDVAIRDGLIAAVARALACWPS
jgi:adenine deaminase